MKRGSSMKRNRPVPEDSRVIATYPICNYGGVEILSVKGDDDAIRAEVAINTGDRREYRGFYKVNNAKKNGRAFFKMFGSVFWLDQFQRI